MSYNYADRCFRFCPYCGVKLNRLDQWYDENNCWFAVFRCDNDDDVMSCNGVDRWFYWNTVTYNFREITNTNRKIWRKFN